MARTIERYEVLVDGGPVDGLRMQVKVKDDGLWEFPCGHAFFPDGLDDYEADVEGRRLVFRGER